MRACLFRGVEDLLFDGQVANVRFGLEANPFGGVCRSRVPRCPVPVIILPNTSVVVLSNPSVP